MYCPNCGIKVTQEAKFCPSCGIKLIQEEDVFRQDAGQTQSAATEDAGKTIPDQMRSTFLHATERINGLVGEKGNIDLNLGDIFSSVFKKHSKEEGEILFISGTSLTTPGEEEISTSWPKPWLFSRIFLILAVTYLFLYVCTYMFHNPNALPGLIVVGSFVVPFSLLIFFWEMNAPRNLSIYEIAKMFFIGGTASLVTTLILFSIVPVYNLNVGGAIIVGVVEEVGKLVIILYFIKKLNPKYILNGLLIGAAIGAGFAAFESAGYAFRFGTMNGTDFMLSVMFDRAWMSIGTHVSWAAITGAALVYVKKAEPLKGEHLTDAKFLKLFAVPVILHSVWDMPLYLFQVFNLMYIVLIIIAWIFIFTLIHAGLKQIVRLNVGQ
ncbi:PrsW family intramembrane metalloprotease [Oceanobacillus iheyensis]|nr:PrsW family intramembrane metalloprotease [Oceanobacillus iheyensis]